MNNNTIAGIFLLLCQFIFAQQSETHQDTLFVYGSDAGHLSKYVFYHVDETNNATPEKIDWLHRNDKLKRWELNETLNLGLNPHPLWLYLNVKHLGELPQKYWWNLYSHADAVYVYEKNEDGKGWLLYDVLSYDTPLSERTVKTRFLATEFTFNPNEGKVILLKIKNLRHSQYAVTDFTTPVSNLLWEKEFYWNIGFFVGCFALIGLLSLCIGFFTKQLAFIRYCGYLFFIILLLLSEELLITVTEWPILFELLKRVHALPIAIIAVGLHFYILKFIVQSQFKNDSLIKRLSKIINAGILFGVIFLATYFFFKNYFTFERAFFIYLWHTAIAIAILMLLLTSAMVFVALNTKRMWWIGLLVALVLLYFNPVGYFLNYSGLIPYYKVTYPNYFYAQLCLEFLFLGGLITWRYQRTVITNYSLLQEKALKEEQDLQRALDIQQTERRQIARDLHDNLGATLSVIKLVITNSYREDYNLIKMITRANDDLRHFFSQLYVIKNDKLDLFKQLEEKIDEFNKVGAIHFVWIKVGNPLAVSVSISESVFLIASELLSNALKHSHANEVTLQLLIETDQLQLVYEDDGKGFDAEKSNSKGMGMRNINTRVHQWDGEIYISSNKLGTTIIITIPL